MKVTHIVQKWTTNYVQSNVSHTYIARESWKKIVRFFSKIFDFFLLRKRTYVKKTKKIIFHRIVRSIEKKHTWKNLVLKKKKNWINEHFFFVFNEHKPLTYRDKLVNDKNFKLYRRVQKKKELQFIFWKKVLNFISHK